MKFIPLEKQQKKYRRTAAAKMRGSWNGVKPVTRVVPDKRKRLRKENKRENHDTEE